MGENDQYQNTVPKYNGSQQNAHHVQISHYVLCIM